MITKAQKEFMQVIVANIVIVPEGEDPIDFAERMWQRMCARGYGDTIKNNTTAKTGKERVSTDWIGKLEKEHKIGFEYFNQLLSIWNDTRGINFGAKAWLEMCKSESPTAEQFKHRVYAAGVYAAGRKQNPADPIMLQGWINKQRYIDVKPLQEVKSQAMDDAVDEEIRTLMGDQARYQIELDKKPDDNVLIEIMQSIKSRLKKARSVKND